MLEISNGGVISSDTLGTGNAGNIDIKANELKIGSQGYYFKAGIVSDSLGIKGNAGSITVETTNNLDMLNGVISTNTNGTGSAGNVNVKASNLTLDNATISAKAAATSTGQTGYVNISATDKLVLTNQGKLSIENAGKSSNSAAVVSGILTVNAPQIELDNGIITAATSGNVNAGEININATQSLSEKNLSTINSLTSGTGRAGTVKVNGPLISLDSSRISAEATDKSSGQTGNVTVTAYKTLQLANQSKISIQNNATVKNPTAVNAGVITVSAPDINLKDSAVTAESTGNIDAGGIVTNFSHQLDMDSSFITTSAAGGNGGGITVNGGELINLQNSGFTTSVTGAKGDGGNINVAADIMVMKTGVIQANALSGKGGDIGLNLKALIPSYDALIKGGAQVDWQPYKSGFNVIQAASATGVSGNINLASPQFNISGAISGLDAGGLVLPVVNRNPCQGAALGSSLVRSGKGGIPVTESKHVFVSPITVPQSSPILHSTRQGNTQPCAAILP